MKTLIVALTLSIFARGYADEVTVCNGTFVSGQPAHVAIDWDTKTVKINRFKTSIESVTPRGIITANYKNRLDQETSSIIEDNTKLGGTIIVQLGLMGEQIVTTDNALLQCNQPFHDVFANRMVE